MMQSNEHESNRLASVHRRRRFPHGVLREAMLGGVLCLLVVGATVPQALPPVATRKVDFASDVEPILARSCIQCHGAEVQMGGLRLDTRAAAIAGGRSGAVIRPGDSAGSRLIRLVAGLEDKLVMPMSGARLTTAEVGVLRAWVDQGANWSEQRAGAIEARKHWAYLPPRRLGFPTVKTETWVRNPIDRFILASIEQAGLSPSPEASREALLRRVSLDLTGLPPTLAEIDAFLSDASSSAYEKAVERLLASPHFGERWARPWLDAARYADSHGWGNDEHRSVWLYRDWVVAALNRDMPFDQFTIEQIAGDLLPDATVAQKVATGFHRNTLINNEAGIDPEEFRIAAVLDRAETTATVWLGATLGCARCHDHKFDPFSQEEYYRFVAFFNNTDDEVDFYERENKPLVRAGLRVPEVAQLEPLRRRVEVELARAEEEYQRTGPELEQGLVQWQKEARDRMAAWRRLQPSGTLSLAGAALNVQPDGSVLASGPRADQEVYVVWSDTSLEKLAALRIEALTHPSLPLAGSSRSPDGTFILTDVELEVAARAGEETWRRIELTSAAADISARQTAAKYAIDDDPSTGWGNGGERDTPPPVAHQLVVLPREPVMLPGGARLRVRLRHEEHAGNQALGRFRLSISDVSGAEKITTLPVAVQEVLAAAPPSVVAQERVLIEEYRRVAPTLLPVRQRIASLQRRLAELATPSAYVLAELSQPRPMHVLAGGNYRNAGKLAPPGVPAVLHPFQPNGTANRLALARWLVDKQNPLVARVAVNRLWQEVFGRGLLETPEDFGSRAGAPTHPELLDWLAVEFMDRGWSVKTLLRTVVTSAAYRQDSRLTPELAARDPENRLLARSPRLRLPAETIRDTALAASGLLDETLGGPAVFPPQPEGVWPGFGAEDVWVTSSGPERYRRALYTYWRRTTLYPAFAAFDAPSREVCVLRRAQTNTPLQSLTTLNDAGFFDMARGLARRVLSENRGSDADRLKYAFRLCTSRLPGPKELAPLERFLVAQRERFAREIELTRRVTSGGDVAPPSGAEAAEFAAWTLLSNVLLNLDETLTKG